jgi:hypothetical protein
LENPRGISQRYAGTFNFFFMPAYSRAYLRIRDSRALDARSRETIERDLAQSLDLCFYVSRMGRNESRHAAGRSFVLRRSGTTRVMQMSEVEATG